MRIELRPDWSLLIVIPSGTREDQWLTFVLSKRGWIEKALRRSSGQENAPEQLDLTFPGNIELLCTQQQYQISRQAGSQNRCVVVADTLKLVCNNSTDEQLFSTLRHWLMGQARVVFSARLEMIASETGLTWNKLSIRGQKTRWGSCSAKANLSLNFKMLFLPPELVDHVLLHELVHTRELNHSQRFWALMRRFDPECDQHRTELRKAGQLLPGWVAKL